MLYELIDARDQVPDTAEAAATNGPLGNQSEPAFHLIEPERIGGCVVDVETGRVAGQTRTLACLWVGGNRSQCMGSPARRPRTTANGSSTRPDSVVSRAEDLLQDVKHALSHELPEMAAASKLPTGHCVFG
jgi:hypothetical protein